MNLPALMMRNMPDRANTTRNYINFMQSIKESVSFGNSRSEDFTLKTILLACMNNSYVEGSSQLTNISRSLETMSRFVLSLTGIAAITKRIPFTTIDAVAYSYA